MQPQPRLARVSPTVAVIGILLMVSLSGCTSFGDFVDAIGRPDIAVSRTDLSVTNAQGYVTDPQFSVSVNQPGGATVRIVATPAVGTPLEITGHADSSTFVSVTLTDGIWSMVYFVDGHEWETFRNVKVDATAPSVAGLRAFGNAEGGRYTIGGAYDMESGATLRIEDGAGKVLSSSVPFTVTGLTSGIHFFLVVVADGAGNSAAVNVQVAAGDAKLLPEGQHTFGIVARYTNNARIWDLSRMDSYATPSEARGAVDNKWLGSGYGVTPEDDVVKATVDSILTNEETTTEIAWSLYRWMFDNLEYDEERLQSNTLMLPRQVIADSEDPDAEVGDRADSGNDPQTGKPTGDGLADDGLGNGIKGGVCRDLAGTYVSMLRAAGVPARLVSGYLAGNVNGFHAWVEVYVGSIAGQSPWMPVDVSPIDGVWDDGSQVPKGIQVSLQSFGIALPSYLALRKVPETSENDGWSTALGSKFTFSGQAPKLSFEKIVADVGTQQEGLLCFDPDTLARKLVADNPNRQDTDQCANMFIIGRDRGYTGNGNFARTDPFVTGTQRIVDYGIQVTSASSGTEITMRLSYPFSEDVSPDTVEWAPYENTPSGFQFSQKEPNVLTGKLVGVLRR